MQSRTEELPSLSEHGKLLPILEKNRQNIEIQEALCRFSDLLSEYTEGCRGLPAFTVLRTRSFFTYKIINGKRNPSGGCCAEDGGSCS